MSTDRERLPCPACGTPCERMGVYRCGRCGLASTYCKCEQPIETLRPAAPSIHATEDGAIGINVGGLVIVKPVEDWHALGSLLERTLEWFEYDATYYAHRVVGASGFRTDQAYERAAKLKEELQALFHTKKKKL